MNPALRTSRFQVAQEPEAKRTALVIWLIRAKASASCAPGFDVREASVQSRDGRRISVVGCLGRRQGDSLLEDQTAVGEPVNNKLCVLETEPGQRDPSPRIYINDRAALGHSLIPSYERSRLKLTHVRPEMPIRGVCPIWASDTIVL